MPTCATSIAARPASPFPVSTRASGCHRWRPWRQGARSPPPPPVRYLRCAATLRCCSIPTTSQRSPPPSERRWRLENDWRRWAWNEPDDSRGEPAVTSTPMSIGSSQVADSVAVAEERPERSSLGRIGASSAVAAGLAMLLNVVAGRTLGVSGYADFLVVWGLFFALTGILPGLQQEVTRSVATARVRDMRGRPPVVGAVIIGIGGGALIALSSPLWASRVLEDQPLDVSVILSAGFLCFAWANHVNGTLAATHRWPL